MIGSLFSGIGGFELGLEYAGLGPVQWQAESDPNCRAWLSDHWPDAHRYEDVRDVDESAPRPWLICGGFPCQDLSCANPGGAGLDGDRSGLWHEFARIVSATGPAVVAVENSHAAWRRWVPFVRRDLWARGYASVPLRVRAFDVGARHARARAFVVGWLADADSDRSGQLQPRRLVGNQWRRLAHAAVQAAADAHQARVRVQPGRGCGSSGAEAVRAEPGVETPADAHGSGLAVGPRIPGDDGAQRQAAERDAGQCQLVELPWNGGPASPALVCRVHEFPPPLAGRPARVGAYGNAVLPAVGHAVGLIIRWGLM